MNQKLKRLQDLAQPPAPRKQSSSFTLSAEDSELLLKIQREIAAPTRSDAVRRCIRLVADDLGLTK